MMQFKQVVIILAVMLMGTWAHIRHQLPYSTTNSMLNLKSQINACMGKTLCELKTSGTWCQLTCFDDNARCNGKKDCPNGLDEMKCTEKTTPMPLCKVTTSVTACGVAAPTANVIATMNTTLATCMEYCNLNKNCKAIVYNKMTMACYLMSSSTPAAAGAIMSMSCGTTNPFALYPCV